MCGVQVHAHTHTYVRVREKERGEYLKHLKPKSALKECREYQGVRDRERGVIREPRSGKREKEPVISGTESRASLLFLLSCGACREGKGTETDTETDTAPRLTFVRQG